MPGRVRLWKLMGLLLLCMRRTGCWNLCATTLPCENESELRRCAVVCPRCLRNLPPSPLTTMPSRKLPHFRLPTGGESETRVSGTHSDAPLEHCSDAGVEPYGVGVTHIRSMRLYRLIS